MGNNFEGVDVGGINTKYDRQSIYILMRSLQMYRYET